MKKMANSCSNPGASLFENPVMAKSLSGSSIGDDGSGDLGGKNQKLDQIMVGSIQVHLTNQGFSPIILGSKASQSSSPHKSDVSDMNEETKRSRDIVSDKFPSMERRLKKKFEKIKPFDICLPRTRRSNLSWRLKKSDETMEKASYGESGFDQRILRPGMILLKRFIDLPEQIRIVKKCREFGVGPAGFYQPGYDNGAKLRLYMFCLGLNWDAQTRKYTRLRPFDCISPPAIPPEFQQMVKRAISDSHSLIKKETGVENPELVLPSLSPDICIVNFYENSGKLGFHKDRDESRNSLRKGLPVVSVSVGDSANFIYGNERDFDKAEKIVLESGDVLIFGGESRHVYHGVSSVVPRSAPSAVLGGSGLRPGRLNLTFRKF